MAHAERRGKFWRARWQEPDGTRASESGFTSKTAALKYASKQEAKIEADVYTDRRAGQITLGEWVNEWFPAQDLELSTLETYRYLIEVIILPEFENKSLKWLEDHPAKVATWERGLSTEGGYLRSTGRAARSMLAVILNDAIPLHIKSNPATRKRGKGKKGQRRIAEAEKPEKVWPSTLQALLFAERCAMLSGDDSDFVLNIAIEYTGMRWSEATGLMPEFIAKKLIHIEWKLYELNGRFYLGRPKDGSIRDADIPPFLSALLEWQIDNRRAEKCSCRNEESPWCPGREYTFLTANGSHRNRSNYSERVVRPAADGWHPGRGGKWGRPAMPVLVDASAPFPGAPLPPWPPAVAGEPYTPPTGRGIQRLVLKDGFGRCRDCARSTELKLDGTLIRHKNGDDECPGSLQLPAEPPPLANWLPLLPGLTEHGQRHGHQVTLDDLNVRYVLQADRMGHEVPGMRGVYSHIAPEWRADLTDGLQRLWEDSLAERARLSPYSAVPLLNDLLADYRTGGV
jgi:integrase